MLYRKDFDKHSFYWMNYRDYRFKEGFEELEKLFSYRIKDNLLFKVRGKRISPSRAYQIMTAEVKRYAKNQFYSDEENYIPHYLPLNFLDSSEFGKENHWLDFEGNLGMDSNSLNSFSIPQILGECLYYADKYPDLEFVLVPFTLDESIKDDEVEIRCYSSNYVLFYGMEDEEVLKRESIGIWVHDGGAEIVDEDKTRELYELYNSDYCNKNLFLRMDWKRFVKFDLDYPLLDILCKEWKLNKNERELLLRKNLPNWSREESDDFFEYAYTREENFLELKENCELDSEMEEKEQALILEGIEKLESLIEKEGDKVKIDSKEIWKDLKKYYKQTPYKKRNRIF